MTSPQAKEQVKQQSCAERSLRWKLQKRMPEWIHRTGTNNNMSTMWACCCLGSYLLATMIAIGHFCMEVWGLRERHTLGITRLGKDLNPDVQCLQAQQGNTKR